jgi:hypothetical protein
MRGEPLELVVRETNVSIARLSEWRDRALTGAATALKERERDDRDDEIARLKGDTQCPPLLHTLLLGSLTQLPFGLKERGQRHGIISLEAPEQTLENDQDSNRGSREKRPTQISCNSSRRSDTSSKYLASEPKLAVRIPLAELMRPLIS